MFLVWSLDSVAKLYYLIVECENARLNECLGLKKVSVFAFLALSLSRTFEAHPYPKFAGVPPPGFNLFERLGSCYKQDENVDVGLAINSSRT